MKTRIQRRGHYLAIPIPPSYAAAMRLEENMTVDITREDDRLIIIPQRTSEWSLQGVFSGVTPQNVQCEVDIDFVAGDEEW